MRLFIAINFNDHVKQKLVEIQNKLKENTLRGKYTAYENLHLTLVFLGEVADNKVPILFENICNIKFSPFNLCIKGVGSFRNDGDTFLWIGIEENKHLSEIHEKLVTQLDNVGFEVETAHVLRRNFTAHITLARRVSLSHDFNLTYFSQKTTAIHAKVSKISLMKSEQVNGQLIYIELSDFRDGSQSQ